MPFPRSEEIDRRTGHNIFTSRISARGTLPRRDRLFIIGSFSLGNSRPEAPIGCWQQETQRWDVQRSRDAWSSFLLRLFWVRAPFYTMWDPLGAAASCAETNLLTAAPHSQLFSIAMHENTAARARLPAST